MTDTNQEPTMEEILASIRRIISEDDAPQDETAPAALAAVETDTAPEPEPEPAAAPEHHPESVAEAEAEPAGHDEILDLTDKVEAVAEAPSAPPMESVGDLDVYSHVPEHAPAPAEPAWTPPERESLVSAPTARSAASSFDHLASSLFMPKEGRTLEDVVQELLRPLLKTWLDENLPAIVQAKVDAEVERIARSRVR